MLISRTELIATIINNADNSLEKCKKNIFSKQSNIYSIIYNNDYQLINYTTFSNLLEIINKQSEYTKEIKGFTENITNKEELLNNINDFIKNDMNIEYLSDNNEIIIPADEMTISFTSTNTQKEKENTNYTTINLGQCENDLKTAYNISKENNLYILKIDKEQKGKNYPVIEYQVYYPLNGGKMELLNLSFCENSDIELSIPVQINDTIDKYNPKSDYYNDICTKSNSDSNIDIPLNDRKNEFKKNNMSLCEEKCELIGYDNVYKKAKCSCAVKTSISLNNIESDNKNLLDNFLDIKSITNIDIIKCYKIVLNLNNLKNSYGSFIFIFIFILYILCINIFYFKSFKNLVKEISIINKVILYNKENQITNNQLHNSIKRSNIKKKRKRKNTKNAMSYDNNFKNLKLKNISLQKDKKNKNKKISDIYKNILKYTESELNDLSYIEALKNDKRTYCQYYWSLLKKKQLILFSFCPNKDYNSQIIKSFLFFFYYGSDFTVNALFFTDNTMHKIYVDSGSFNLNYQLPQILYSFIISSIINYIIEYLSSSENIIISIKSKKFFYLSHKNKIIRTIKIKFLFFFIITFILILVFWYYISCFCCIYQNTQIHLIKDSLLSFGLSLIYPIFISLVPGIFRIPALRNKKCNKSCMYRLSQIIEFF